MNITVLYNTPSDRFAKDAKNREAEDDTVSSAQEVAAALAHKGAKITLTQINEHTIEKTIALLSADVVFNLIEWTGVDTPYAQKTFVELDKRNIRYTGATWENYYLSCDKIALKKQLDIHRFPTARWQAFVSGNEPIRDDFVYPVIVKISLEHSSVGLGQESVFTSKNNLQEFLQLRIQQFQQPVFIEEFLEGREFQVTLIENEHGLRVLPPAEIAYVKNDDMPMLTYVSRWDEHSKEYGNSRVFVPRSDALIEKIYTLSQRAYKELGFRDYARFDIRCKDEVPFFLELNSNPGLGDDEEYGMTLSYKAAGMDFADFIWHIVESAKRRI